MLFNSSQLVCLWVSSFDLDNGMVGVALLLGFAPPLVCRARLILCCVPYVLVRLGPMLSFTSSPCLMLLTRSTGLSNSN